MIFASDNAISLELGAAMGAKWDLVFKSPVGGNDPSSRIAQAGHGGITVELGGNCRTLTSDFHQVSTDLAEGYLNVMRHFKMIDGAANYAPRWRMGYQIALLAPETGMYVGNPNHQMVKERILNMVGCTIAALKRTRNSIDQ